ncbi:ATP-binding cassette domain-containing protein [Streptomyces sp. NPDC021020]|uniref:ATP-binding cassette domain-containing protein n=1 Tax=Streptomyces sp. NPDC021020 TaxID=3365109 RepID=UPI0037ACE7ED
MITLRAVTKRYGPAVAVDNLNLEIPAGRVTGFLGPNGAGKSTTMRMIMGLDRPTTGEALIHGKPYSALKYPLREVGALLDAKALHPGRSARSHLLAMARTNGIPRKRVSEMQLTADHLVVIGRRRLLADDTVEQVIARSSLTAVRVRTPDRRGLDHLAARLATPGVDVRWNSEHEIMVSGATVEAIGDLAFDLGVRLHELRVVEASLEEAYMEMTAGSIEYRSPKPPGAGPAQPDAQQNAEA